MRKLESVGEIFMSYLNHHHHLRTGICFSDSGVMQHSFLALVWAFPVVVIATVKVKALVGVSFSMLMNCH